MKKPNGRMVCDYCGEALTQKERAPNKGSDFHPECLLRGVIGSVAHLQHRCSCYCPGSTEGDPAGLTIRQAAAAAAQIYRQQNHL